MLGRETRQIYTLAIHFDDRRTCFGWLVVATVDMMTEKMAGVGIVREMVIFFTCG